MAYIINQRVKFNPRRVANLAIWWAADQGITLSSSKVSRMNDLSSNGNHAVQGTALNQPTYVNNVINGKPILRFDGTNSFIGCPDSTSFHGQNGSLFVVMKSTGTATCNLAGNEDFNPGRNGITMYLVNGANMHGELSDASSFRGTLAGGPTANNGVAQLLNFTFDSSNILFYVNGALQPAMSLSRAGQAISWAGFDFRLGRNANGTDRNYDGDIAEVLMFISDLAQPDRIAIENYLNLKYRIWS